MYLDDYSTNNFECLYQSQDIVLKNNLFNVRYNILITENEEKGALIPLKIMCLMGYLMINGQFA